MHWTTLFRGGGVAAAPSRVRRTRSFGAILCCAINWVCAWRLNFPALVRPLAFCDHSATSCLPASYVNERGATFACKLGTPCAFMAADGGDHLPLCQYNSAFCADLGHHVYDRPKSRGPLRSLEAPGITLHVPLLAIQVESYGRARSIVCAFGLLRIFATAFARSISYVDVWAVWYVGLGRRYAGD